MQNFARKYFATSKNAFILLVESGASLNISLSRLFTLFLWPELFFLESLGELPSYPPVSPPQLYSVLHKTLSAL